MCEHVVDVTAWWGGCPWHGLEGTGYCERPLCTGRPLQSLPPEMPAARLSSLPLLRKEGDGPRGRQSWDWARSQPCLAFLRLGTHSQS